MSNTFHQIHLHIVFAVKFRDALLLDQWRDELFSYIGGIIRNKSQVPVAIGGWRDHVHILIGCTTQVNIAQLVKDIKLSTNQWLQPRFKSRFAWQDGYGVFSVSKTHEKAVVEYIHSQPQHHSKVRFVDEFKRLLFVNGVGFEEQYLPEEPK